MYQEQVPRGRMSDFYAHSNTSDTSLWEPLEEHLQLVANYCEHFCTKLGAEGWGKRLGLWHDLGKYSTDFQNYLRSANGLDVHESETVGRVDHSSAGAQHASRNASSEILVSNALAYCIAGHHAGLANAVAGGSSRPLSERLTKSIPTIEGAPSEILQIALPQLPQQIEAGMKAAWLGTECKATTANQQETGFTWAFFVRMLFSSLVDADFLATEEFMSPEAAQDRPVYKCGFAEMLECVDAKLRTLSENRTGTIHEIRQEIVAACNHAADQKPGLFSLTVPTGGGKTISGLSFALRHIAANPANRFERIIVAIPFTSIIEQTARVFRDLFEPLGEDVVLETHSNLDLKNETDRSRLASQNFDSPIVVTTNVQLFESLFANRTSKCRKLHNIARSVIILDEAQTLPVEFLKPTLLAIRELVQHYGCSVVLCTATQPAINRSPDFPIGLENVTEIIPTAANLYNRMRRVRVTHMGSTDLPTLVSRLSKEPQFLCIQNTRPDARETYRLLRDGNDAKGLFHLSTFMCPEHRQAVFTETRQRLDQGKRCQVVSTQLIEAGVDVDFSVVYRAIAGLDSIAQAAGRCNREGKRGSGDVYVFSLPKLPPPGFLRATAQTTQSLLSKFEQDLISPEAIEQYFRVHYWLNSAIWDKHGILPMHLDVRRGQVDFASIADAYQIIKDTSMSVLVPFGATGRKLVNRVRRADPVQSRLSRVERRQIERHSVSLFENAVTPAPGRDFEYAYEQQYVILANDSVYDEMLGVDLTKLGFHDSGELVI